MMYWNDMLKKTAIRLILPVLLLLAAKQSNAQVKTPYKIYSPDKTTCLEIGVDAKEKLVYRVRYANREALSWSALGFVLNDIAAGEKPVIENKKQGKPILKDLHGAWVKKIPSPTSTTSLNYPVLQVH